MKCLLVFVPQWSPLQPYLSTPSLVAWLKQQGYPTAQYDMNVAIYDHILSRSYLQECIDILRARLRQLQFDNGEPKSADHYEAIAQALAISEIVLPRVEQAKENLRSPRFKEPDQMTEDSAILKAAMSIVSARFYPTVFTLSDFRMHLTARSSRQVMAALDDPTNPFLELYPQFLPNLLSSDADVIGLSITDHGQLIPGLTLARLIKKARPATHVVIGGALFTRLADQQEKLAPLFDFVDSIIVREGERPLGLLLRALEFGGSMDDVPNLIYRRADGSVTSTTVLPNVGMDVLPTPDFEGLPLEMYLSPEPILPLLTARGCSWGRCTFCDHSYSYEPGLRVRPMAMVINDMQILQERYGARFFALADEDLAPVRAEELSSAIQEAGLKLYWSAETRLDPRFSDGLVHKMAESGCRYVMFGLESASLRVLKLMKKGISPRAAEGIVGRFHDAGVMTHLFVIYGFPGEERDDSLQTLEFLKKNAPKIGSFGYSPFTLNRHSPIRYSYAEYGIRSVALEDDLDFTLFYDFDRPGHPGTLGAHGAAYQMIEQLVPAYYSRRIQELLGREFAFLYAGYGLAAKLRAPEVGRAIAPAPDLPLVRSPLAGFAQLPLRLVKESKRWSLKPGPATFASILGQKTLFEVPPLVLGLLDSCERRETLEMAISQQHEATGIPQSDLMNLAQDMVRIGLAIPGLAPASR